MNPCASLVRTLVPYGIRRVLLATAHADRLAVYRVANADGRLTLAKQGEIDGRGAELIGRVGAPDPRLQLRWQASLTFYGRWFDELESVDPKGALRRKIADAPQETLLTQLERDERYAVVGTYYATFRAILDCKHRLPLVLLDPRLLERSSLPVLLAAAQSEPLERMLRARLYDLTRPEVAGEALVDGIHIEDL